MFCKNVRYLIAVKPCIFQSSFYTLNPINHAMKSNCLSRSTSKSACKVSLFKNRVSSASYCSDSKEDYDLALSLLSQCLDDAMQDQNTHLSLLVSSSLIQNFCESYENLLPDSRKRLLLFLCDQYGVQHKKVINSCDGVLNNAKLKKVDAAFLQSEERLRVQLQPAYSHLFKLIGRLHDGVKFLIDMRYDALNFASSTSRCESSKLRDLSNQLKSILAIWFSVGLLQLTRITWETPADILEKIAKNEAVHSVRGWTDLKKRLGPNRRCYAFFHSNMSREPLLLLHVALTHEITENITDIVSYSSRNELPESSSDDKTTAIFYSITSTQKGLQGIEFGVHMIRAVVDELKANFNSLSTFSSLSPIPRFKTWFFSHLSDSMKTGQGFLLPEEAAYLKSYFQVTTSLAVLEQLRLILSENSWTQDQEAISLLRTPLLRLCAEYLYNVKSRGSAFDPVANFHLRNGANLWRINWMADPSTKGLDQSFGLMVNYRYYLDRMEANSRQYILQKEIPVSSSVIALIKKYPKSVL